MSGTRKDIRYDAANDLWLLRCGPCAGNGHRTTAWWPLDKSFWNPRSSLMTCRACANDKRRLARRAAMDAKEKQRRYYADHREHRLAWVAAYRERRRDEINALRRAAYARKVAARREVEG